MSRTDRNRSLRHRWSASRPQRGSAMVEFALILILLLTLLFSIVGFAEALYAYHYVNNAAKEATRWAAVNGSTCGNDSSCNGAGNMNTGPATASNVNTFVQSRVPQGIIAANVVTSACGVKSGTACAASTPQICSKAVGSLPATPNYPGCTVQVTVSYPYQFPFALLNSLIPSANGTQGPCTQPGICLSSSSEMIIAH